MIMDPGRIFVHMIIELDPDLCTYDYGTGAGASRVHIIMELLPDPCTYDPYIIIRFRAGFVYDSEIGA